MLTVWRIVPEHRAPDAFDGEGARLFGGRWNSRGIRMVYTSESRALAALETLVHLTPKTLHRRLCLIGAEIDPGLVETCPEGRLPPDWRAPLIPATTKSLGDDWIRSGRSAVLRICSAIVPEENNYLLNPAHPAFAHLRIGHNTPFSLDARLTAHHR